MNKIESRNSSKNCVIWSRVSTKFQEENGGSLDYQKSLCEKYATEHGYNIVGHFGGKHESAKTPGDMIKTMVKTVKKDKSIRSIIVSEYDRFSRNTAQALNILEQLKECGVVVISAKDGRDTSTKDGYLMATISLGLAKWDNDNRVDKFISGRTDCLLKGVWAERAPMGYYKEGRSKNTICKVNDTGRLIRQAFMWKLAYCSNTEILERLETRGLKISPQQLHKILVNPFYAGKISHKLINNQIIDGVHEPLITYQQFLKVQEILSGRTGRYTHKKHREDCPLKHHILCDKDNTPLTYYTVKKKNGKEYGYYKCNEKGCCTNISSKKLHQYFYNLLQDFALPEMFKPILKEMISEKMSDKDNVVREQITLLKKRLTEVEKNIKTCQMRFATGVIDDEIFGVSIQEFEKEKGNIALELEKYNEKISNSSMEVDEIIASCCKLGELWINAEYDTCKKIQNLVFPNGIKWDIENGHYRTQNRNSVLDLFDKVSGIYKKETGAENSAPVNLYWVGESNSYCEIENLEY